METGQKAKVSHKFKTFTDDESKIILDWMRVLFFSAAQHEEEEEEASWEWKAESETETATA